MENEWKSFTFRIPINASPKSVYESWATPQGLESWFLRQARYTTPNGATRAKNELIHAGDEYHWLWHGYGDHVEEKHPVLEANGWDHLRFRFSGDCEVSVRISQQDGFTICELSQEMPMEDEKSRKYFFIECGRGWTFYLSNLKSILEGGVDLRNKNTGLHPVIN